MASSKSSYQKDFASKCRSLIKAGNELLATDPLELKISIAQASSNAMNAMDDLNPYLRTGEESKNFWVEFALILYLDFDRELQSTPTQKDLRELAIAVSRNTEPFAQQTLSKALSKIPRKSQTT